MTVRSDAIAAVAEAKKETLSLWITITLVSSNPPVYDPDDPTATNDTPTVITGLETKFTWLETNSGNVQINDRRFLIEPADFAAVKLIDHVLIDSEKYEILQIHKIQQDVLYKLDIRGA